MSHTLSPASSADLGVRALAANGLWCILNSNNASGDNNLYCMHPKQNFLSIFHWAQAAATMSYRDNTSFMMSQNFPIWMNEWLV